MPPGSDSAFGLDSVAADEARTALDKILQSAEFVASPQLCAFLTYIVEARLEGREHTLKGQTIGTVVLGRPEGYDSQRDPIVRVEANRLRRTLASYYERSGAEDPVRVVVERGSYVPRFERLAPAPPPVPDAASLPQPPPALQRPPPTPAPQGYKPSVIVIGAVLASIAIALLGTFLLLKQRPPGVQLASPPILSGPAGAALGVAPQATSPYLPSIEVMPFAATGEGEIAERSEELVSGLTVALARFPELRVIAVEGLPADFRLEGEISVSDRKSTVAMRLLSNRAAEVLWSTSIDMPLTELLSRAGIDRLMAVATTAIAPQFGALAQYLSRGDDSLAGEANGYDCLIEAQLQRHHLDGEAWGKVDRCLRDLIERYPNFATAQASRALLLMENFRLNPDSAAARAMLKEADELARHALQLEPANVRAMTAVATVALAKGDLEAARTTGLRAISANPHDPLSRTQYVLALIASDYPDQALQQSAAARLLDPAHISFYDSLEFLARLGKPARIEPTSSAVMADVSLLPYGAIARILAYDTAGQAAERDVAVQALYHLMPLFETDMPTALSRQFPPSLFAQRLQAALHKAGVGA